MKQEFQLESRKYNLICSGLWGMFNRLETVLRVSTVKLPGNHGYETCVFFGPKSNEVVETYGNEDEATAGHVRHARYYGLNTVKIST